MNTIRTCTACNLCSNQPPLVQTLTKSARAMFVGLSAVRVDNVADDEPLSANTRSGALLRSVVGELPWHTVYFTNLVKCLPLRDGRIRYPNKHEIDACLTNLHLEVQHFRPRRIVLLGQIVADTFAGHFGIVFKYGEPDDLFPVGTLGRAQVMAAYHPSYALVYKRREIESYKIAISTFIASPLRSAH